MTEKILEAISIMIKGMEYPYDKTFPSVIYGKDENGKYQIPYEGQLRSIQNSLPCDLTNGQLVWVKIPNGKLRNMHVCGLRQK